MIRKITREKHFNNENNRVATIQKIILSIVLIGTSVIATPTTYNNTGLVTKIEKFAPICDYYVSIATKNLPIKPLCKKYKKNLHNTLKLGYTLDKSSAENSSLLEKYRTKLFSLDELQEQITAKISHAKTKARNNGNVTYHEKIIRKDIIPLYKSDYEFIAKHKDIYEKANNKRYFQMIKEGRKELLSDSERKIVLRKAKAKAIREKIAECQYEMTVAGHSNHQSGKISQGRVTGSNKVGIGVMTKEGAFLIKNAPYHATGRITTPIYVRSRGEVIVQPKIDLGNPHPGNAYHFYMKRVGLYNMVWNNSYGGRVLTMPEKRYVLEYDSDCAVSNETTMASTTDMVKNGCPEMSHNRHFKKMSGKLMHGIITNGYRKSGYYLEIDDTVYKILGTPKLALGEITSPLYVESKGETEWIWITSAVNAKKTWMRVPSGGLSAKKGLIVYYLESCGK